MKKTIILILAAAALLLALFAAGPALYESLSGRSLAAAMFSLQFHKDAYDTPEAFDAYIEQKRAENAEDYDAPSAEDFTVFFEEGNFGEMQYFVLNDAEGADKLLFYFPGGSFIDQPRETHWTFLNSLAEDTGAAVVVPIYPKLPAYDAETAYAELIEFYMSFMAGQVCGELIFMGDSAGGGMALSLAMQLRDAALAVPDKLILICPWADVTMENPDIPAYEAHDRALDSEMLAHLGALWAGELSPTDPIVSPLYGDLDGLGAITLVTTTGELLYPDIMRLDAALTAADADHSVITAERLFHIWPLYKDFHIPEAQAAYDELVLAVRG